MQAKFTQGPILRHISVMTLSGTVGLISLFLVDLIDMYFLSLLGQIEIAAALGYAGSILFFTISINIGLSIGCGATVARVAGSGDKEQAKRRIAHIFAAIVLASTPITVLILVFLNTLLTWLGAEGEAHRLATQYLVIILPTVPIMGLAMACSGVTRALGDAKAAMYLTLIGAAVNAVLDPIFIFGLGLEMQGAAIATVGARFAMLAYGLYIVIQKNGLLGRMQLTHFKRDCHQYAGIALPAVLTNLSTPIGIAYITAVMATFGDEAVGGNAIVGRVQQVAFAGLFALSGAIGSIAAQNLGANQFDRVKETLDKSLLFIVVYCAVACGLLFVATNPLIAAFKAEGEAAQIIRWYCYGFSLIFLFNGATFVTNALFNNLGVAHYATQFNFGKATLGTIPFVYFGAQLAGPFGIYAGALIGAGLVAALGVYVAYQHINKLSHGDKLAQASQQSQ